MSRPRQRSGGLLGVLGTPTIRGQAVSGLLAQLTQGAATVGIILVVRQHTGSLALAGVVAGALSVAAAVARPLQGRVIDRGSVRGLTAASGLVHGLALVAIVACAAVDASGVVLVAFGCLAGLTLPPVSTAMRVHWAALIPATERSAAYGLVYLTQELSILVAPLILAAVIALASASAALIVVAALSAAGSLGFAAALKPLARAVETHNARANVLRIGAFRVLLAVGLLTGAVIGALEVAAPTLAASHRQPATAGLLIACLSVGGIAGAAIFANRRWRLGPQALALRLLALLTLVLAASALTHGLVLAGVLFLAAGLPLNPALTTFSLLVDQHVPVASAGEAFGWLSTGLSGGSGAASAIAAAVASTTDARAAFVVAGIAGALGTAVIAAGRSALSAASANGRRLGRV